MRGDEADIGGEAFRAVNRVRASLFDEGTALQRRSLLPLPALDTGI
jgi:hypothetical protein